jgi:3-hydroxyisobutyrate dehydrogenase-like beta-hydroxyacid dehydrogenase
LNVAFIGVGRIGAPMAARVATAGHALTIYDVNRAALEPLHAAGARIATTCRDAVGEAEAILVAVPGPAEVAAAFDGADGILAGVGRGSVVVEMSTIGAQQARDCAQRCRERGAAYLDAPVSGGVAGAADGTLTVMAGGDAADLARVDALLHAFAAHVVHLGPVGSGCIAKIANQMVYLSYVAVYCEAVALAQRAGVDVPTLLDVLHTSVAGAPLVTGWDERIRSGDVHPGFQTKRALKDLELGADACAAYGFDPPAFAGSLRSFRDAAAAGHSDDDMTAIFRRFTTR